MWISKKMSEASHRGEPYAGLGQITIGGEETGVMTESEQRNIPVISPGGFVWRPKTGQDVLIIQTDDGGKFITGALYQGDGEALQDGEAAIYSEGASIIMRNNGLISISGNLNLEGKLSVSGDVSISGNLTVKGVPYSP